MKNLKRQDIKQNKRLDERVNFDLEMIKELDILELKTIQDILMVEAPGTRPFCLLDYFPNDFITVIDESHVTLPQIRAMYGVISQEKLI